MLFSRARGAGAASNASVAFSLGLFFFLILYIVIVGLFGHHHRIGIGRYGVSVGIHDDGTRRRLLARFQLDINHLRLRWLHINDLGIGSWRRRIVVHCVGIFRWRSAGLMSYSCGVVGLSCG
jgi:hypothetical protein